jgi:hypothetical protein
MVMSFSGNRYSSIALVFMTISFLSVVYYFFPDIIDCYSYFVKYYYKYDFCDYLKTFSLIIGVLFGFVALFFNFLAQKKNASNKLVSNIVHGNLKIVIMGLMVMLTLLLVLLKFFNYGYSKFEFILTATILLAILVMGVIKAIKLSA